MKQFQNDGRPATISELKFTDPESPETAASPCLKAQHFVTHARKILGDRTKRNLKELVNQRWTIVHLPNSAEVANALCDGYEEFVRPHKKTPGGIELTDPAFAPWITSALSSRF